MIMTADGANGVEIFKANCNTINIFRNLFHFFQSELKILFFFSFDFSWPFVSFFINDNRRTVTSHGHTKTKIIRQFVFFWEAQKEKAHRMCRSPNRSIAPSSSCRCFFSLFLSLLYCAALGLMVDDRCSTHTKKDLHLEKPNDHFISLAVSLLPFNPKNLFLFLKTTIERVEIYRRL
jgi:hypothetical protein